MSVLLFQGSVNFHCTAVSYFGFTMIHV